MKVLHRTTGAYAALLFAFIVCASQAHAELRIDGELIEGAETNVFYAGTDASGTELRVVYYPGSDVEVHETIGAPSEAGHVSWTPAHAGLALLEVAQTGSDEIEESEVVAVRYRSAPVGALVMFAFAAVMLFGSLTVAIVRMRETRRS